MWIENIAYIITFVLSAGMSAVGILIAFQLYQQFKKPELSILLYQQIFLFSFLLYSIWGNVMLRIILNDVSLNPEISAKLSVFIPMIGLPFMIVSWYMLLRFAMSLNKLEVQRNYPYVFFPTLVVIVIVLILFIQKQLIIIPDDADLFIVRIIAGLNLLIHLIFLLSFLLPKQRKYALEIGFGKREASMFFFIVVIYSAAMSFFNVYGFISICISIALLFAAGVYIPFTISYQHRLSTTEKNMNFETFCENYEISKREAEIILEICSGKTNKAIADKLFITLQTVKDHNHRIFTKTGVKSRVQLSNLVRKKTGQN